MRNFLKQIIKWQKARKSELWRKRNHTRVYLSGAITGIHHPEHLFNAGFRYVLLTFGSDTEVINPLNLCSKKWSWLRCMAKCLWHLRTCDVIVLLSNWKYSRGAKIERKVAFYLGIKIMYAPAFVESSSKVAANSPVNVEQDNEITGFPI